MPYSLNDDEIAVLITIYEWEHEPYPDPDYGDRSPVSPVPDYLLNGIMGSHDIIQSALNALLKFALVKQPTGQHFARLRRVLPSGQILTATCTEDLSKNTTTYGLQVDGVDKGGGKTISDGRNPNSYTLTADGILEARRLRELAVSEGKSRSAAPRTVRGRGRPPDTDPEKDQQILEAWDSGGFKTYADLARERNRCESKTDIKLAVDRARKRRKK